MTVWEAMEACDKTETCDMVMDEECDGLGGTEGATTIDTCTEISEMLPSIQPLPSCIYRKMNGNELFQIFQVVFFKFMHYTVNLYYSLIHYFRIEMCTSLQ